MMEDMLSSTHSEASSGMSPPSSNLGSCSLIFKIIVNNYL